MINMFWLLCSATSVSTSIDINNTITDKNIVAVFALIVSILSFIAAIIPLIYKAIKPSITVEYYKPDETQHDDPLIDLSKESVLTCLNKLPQSYVDGNPLGFAGVVAHVNSFDYNNINNYDFFKALKEIDEAYPDPNVNVYNHFYSYLKLHFYHLEVTNNCHKTIKNARIILNKIEFKDNQHLINSPLKWMNIESNRLSKDLSSLDLTCNISHAHRFVDAGLEYVLNNNNFLIPFVAIGINSLLAEFNGNNEQCPLKLHLFLDSSTKVRNPEFIATITRLDGVNLDDRHYDIKIQQLKHKSCCNRKKKTEQEQP